MDATMENKMGLPPPYSPHEATAPNPAPPPSYFGNNPPPPPGVSSPPTAPPRTIVVTSPAAPTTTAAVNLGPGRTGIKCPSCQQQIVTRVHYVPNNRTHIISAGLCIISACCCGCLFPYCMKSCKTANHYCPRCKAFVGTHVPS